MIFLIWVNVILLERSVWRKCPRPMDFFICFQSILLYLSFKYWWIKEEAFIGDNYHNLTIKTSAVIFRSTMLLAILGFSTFNGFKWYTELKDLGYIFSSNFTFILIAALLILAFLLFVMNALAIFVTCANRPSIIRNQRAAGNNQSELEMQNIEERESPQ
jgi:hypothetical protein